jgi:pimeloyl-ACP methyl ester carboxylesterase
MKTLLSPPSFDDLYRLLRAWRFWLVGALLGGLLGMAVYAIFPPDYRARATVMVDFNVEQSWTDIPDREVFYFLERETRKLVELAWADDVMRFVADENGLDIPTLRSGALILSQPSDGGWHFYADSADAALAAKLAGDWARAFTRKAAASADQFTPYLVITPTQTQNLPVNRAIPLGTYALAGAGLGLVLLASWVLFFHPLRRN